MELIKQWLNGSRNYDIGVRLYLQFGDSPLHKKLFTAESETPFKRSQLETLLLDIHSRSKEPTDIKAAKIPRSEPELIKSWPADAVKDDIEKSLRSTWLEKYREMHDLRSQLLLLPNDDQRAEAAFKIIRLDRECDEIILTRDHYLVEGKLPDQPTTEYIQDPLQMGVRITALQRYIRRETAKLKDNPSDTKIVARRREFIDEFNYYMSKFGKPPYAEKSSTDAGT